MPNGYVRLHRKTTRAGKEYELSRRQFMQLVGASAALAAASGCQPDRPEAIMPYVRQPLASPPGQSVPYATSYSIDGFATGLLVSTREGRPIKVEGNPAHPASLGATSMFHQAAVLQLYDPDRAKSVSHRGLPAQMRALELMLGEERTDRGAGLRLVLEPTSSPLLLELLTACKRVHPESRITFYAPLAGASSITASARVFGRPFAPQYRLAPAQVVVLLDSDLLSTPYQLSYARDFAKNRQLATPGGEMNRLYAVECAVSVSGSMADHRLARRSQRVAAVTAALAGQIVDGLPREALSAIETRLDEPERRFVRALARDLRQRPRGRTLIVPGDRQPPEVHTLGHAINQTLGNLGASVSFTDPAVAPDAGDQDLAALAAELHAGTVDTLIVLGANPSYDALPELEWSRAMRRARRSIYGGAYQNETAHDADWFVPLAHPFETWGDGRSYDGTLSFVQPLIRPLYASKSVSELLALLAREPAAGDYARLRVRFGRERGEGLTLFMSAAERKQYESQAVRQSFEAALARGFSEDTAFASVDVSVTGERVVTALHAIADEASSDAIELDFLPSPTLHDGRFANVSWLLELPEPITKLTWDNAALLSPNTARALGVPQPSSPDEDEFPLIELKHAGRTLRVPALCVSGHADGAISLWLGYGRDGGERLAEGVGSNAYRLRTRAAEHFARGVEIEVLDQLYPLAFSQHHRDQHGRPIALATTLERYRAAPDFTAEYKGNLASLMSSYEQSGPQWAMSIDMSMCTGCSACVVACQAENNVLVVGKEQVRRGRIMHWLRIDAYEDPDDPARIVHQPMLCQHCEDAPCEYVCPVNATDHSPDGLNEMIYNRCIGTRFCSNNCPYKVRRFNWFNWQIHTPANAGSVALQRNPEVTVRERGVMEKCTYCVQRIRAAEITARIEQREIRTGEVVTACQQACPTRAITFDSLTHKESTMVRWREQQRSYAVLHETGTRPRTMYLARVRNPNPELA